MRRLIALVLIALGVPAIASARMEQQAGHDAQTHQHPASQQAVAADAAAIETWLNGYDAAFVAKDLDKLSSYYDPQVTIYEGGGINNGRADYRDHHLAREIDSGGLETLVLLKGADGAWKIRHSHTSARARRPAGGGL
jgi:ketosteroid isomerase-like protein